MSISSLIHSPDYFIIVCVFHVFILQLVLRFSGESEVNTEKHSHVNELHSEA